MPRARMTSPRDGSRNNGATNSRQELSPTDAFGRRIHKHLRRLDPELQFTSATTISGLPRTADMMTDSNVIPLRANWRPRPTGQSTTRASADVGLTRHQSGGLQGRRDDRARCNARRRAGQRDGKLRNRETCGFKGRRDDGVGVERRTHLLGSIISS